MTLFKNTLASLFIIGFLVVLAYGFYYAFQFVIGTFSGLEPMQKTVFFTGALTMLLSALVIAMALRGLGKRLQNRRLREEKLAAYGNLINAWRALVRASQGAIRPDEEQVLHDIESHLTLVAGSRVLQHCRRLKEMQNEPGIQCSDVSAQFEKVILEIRRDLGFADWAHKDYNIFDLFIAKPDEEQSGSATAQSVRPSVQMPPT